MIINWVAAKAQQFLPEQDVELDEFNVDFDFALSPEIMNLLYAQNDCCMDVGDKGVIAEPGQQETKDINATGISQFVLDEYELALA